MKSEVKLGTRRYLVIAHRADHEGDFNLNDLPSSGGRMDALASSVCSALLLSNDIRKDASICIAFPGGEQRKCVLISGDNVRYLNPDERSTAALIRNAQIRGRREEEVQASPGVYFFKETLGGLLRYMSKNATVCYLTEQGERGALPDLPGVFVLGDVDDLTKEEEQAVLEAGARPISISPRSMHTAHCITVVNWMLDNRFV